MRDVKNETYNDVCPLCDSETIDYEELYDTCCYCEATFLYWECRCVNCGARFRVRETYHRVCAELSEIEKEEENA